MIEKGIFMKKKIAFFVLMLFCLLTAEAQSARSGFVDGFDESKYEPIWISSIERIENEAYKAGVYESAPEMAFKSQGHLVLNEYDKDDPDIQMRNLRFFGDGEYCFGFWADGKSFPDDMPLFTSVEIYYSFVANRFRGEDVLICYIDGWEVVDDVRFVDKKYVATDNLRIRSTPSLDAEKIGLLKKKEKATVIEVGEDVTIDGIESAWVKVLTKDGAEGWCFAGYLTDGTEYREKPWKSTDKAEN